MTRHSTERPTTPLPSALRLGDSFEDTWTLLDVGIEWLEMIEKPHSYLRRMLMAAMTDSDKSSLIYMTIRLLEMKRLLKSTGFIFLHCDPSMIHLLKLVMDAIFGQGKYRYEICCQCHSILAKGNQHVPRA
ncbi:MAG: hypothetical protein OXI44_09480 [Bacteroidota bacterium]|nr:hypothetical protein [Bacteroidota bacterium]